MPQGYQPRLTRLAADVVRESAVRAEDGSFSYPAQFRGSNSGTRSFLESLQTQGAITDLGSETTEDYAQIWFEYAGDMSPREMGALAELNGLEVVHCGVTLYGSPVTE